MREATGYVRPVDELSRIVLPMGIRKERGIEPKAELEIYVDGNSIVLQRSVPGCLFCGASQDLATFKGKLVCRECAATLTAIHARAAD